MRLFGVSRIEVFSKNFRNKDLNGEKLLVSNSQNFLHKYVNSFFPYEFLKFDKGITRFN
jgi:hypothetical protein